MSGTPDVELTFDALPPERGRGFAQTWWGRAWLKALEDTALDGEQLKKGRRHAREGAVGAVSVRPGRITAVVRDRDGTAYRSDVLLRELDEAEWDRFLGTAVDRAGHIAALLDREMPPHLVEDAAAAGVELLPGIGDLEPKCTCDAWDHCFHTAALCYQVARLLDQDPFVLLLMRGRAERRLLDELQARSVARASTPSPQSPPQDEPPEVTGVRADEAFAARDILPPLPPPPPLPEEAGPPPALDTETRPAPGIDPDALQFLAADAAARARSLLAAALAPGHEEAGPSPVLTPRQDAVRMAASSPGPVIEGRIATGTGRSGAELDLAVRAWRYGGAASLAVLEDDVTPDPASAARAAAALDAAWAEGDESSRPRLRPAGAARWTVVGAQVQLRLGPDGRWWPYRRERAVWAPAGPASADPASALALALGERTAED
ncbi:SWF or SNF family helicase [Streptomyces sp. PKU-EA00015]|uniref:SWIM zinc finger family protein n=1 Tax=Streptomyces sp. PKU-EA00015 TaxID=2748326 RepID=UPI0015A2D2AA|nr:SWF or SNF family helicase [Streptomyces sp. PKU-EA00015]NWF28675.1 SWF or SNF family helicase [Streptomyces sp. PKU-EA00015]